MDHLVQARGSVEPQICVLLMASCTPDPSQQIVLGWKPGISVRIHDNILLIENLNRPFRLALKHGFETRAIELLHQDCPEEEIGVTMASEHGVNALSWTHQFLNYVKSRGCVCYSIKQDDRVLMRIVPFHAGVRPSEQKPSPPTLSPTILIRFEGQTVLFEDPRAKGRAELACPKLTASLFDPLENSTAESDLAWQLLYGVELARSASANTIAAPCWQPHEAFFHYRSRMGGHDYKYGGTFPGKSLGTTPPPLSPEPRNEPVALPSPNEKQIGKDFLSVSEARRSVRTYADRPLLLQELADFLYWSVRFTSVVSEDGMEMGFKPVASGGAIHEIEVYPCLRDIDGVENGLYRYDAVKHSLEKLPPSREACQPLFDMAWVVNGQQGRPPVVITLAVNMERIAWKYESVAYALALKHVGAIYQQFYLVATALGLAPCGLGGGDSHLFASISGLDAQKRPAVGEFILGPRSEKPLSEQSKQVDTPESVVREYLTALGAQNVEDSIGLLAPDLDHQIPGLPHGRDAFVSMVKTYQSAFTEWALKLETIHAAGSNVTVKSVVSGLHSSSFLGHAPTQKRFSVRGLSLYHVEDGKIVKLTEMFDTFGMLKQLGIV